MKYCRICGRPKHRGVCNMVTLVNGRSVHADRVEKGGDHYRTPVSNRWVKKDMLKKKKDEA